MSVALLDKTRKFNKLIHNSTYEDFDIHRILESFEPLVLSDVFIVDADGKIIDLTKSAAVNRLFEFSDVLTGSIIDINLLKRMEMMASTRENVSPSVLGLKEPGFEAYFMVIPLEGFGARFGYLLMYRNQTPYDIDDIVLAEYIGTLISLEMASSSYEDKVKGSKNSTDFRRIIRTMSETELKAAVKILEALKGEDGIIKISELAKSIEVTRSVVVNAIKKLDTAGVISSKSCGPKGTFIQIYNDIVYKEIVSLNEING